MTKDEKIERIHELCEEIGHLFGNGIVTIMIREEGDESRGVLISEDSQEEIIRAINRMMGKQ